MNDYQKAVQKVKEGKTITTMEFLEIIAWDGTAEVDEEDHSLITIEGKQYKFTTED